MPNDAHSEIQRLTLSRRLRYFVAQGLRYLVAPVFLLTASYSIFAQEMEPRSYSRAPVGSQFVVFSYAYQSGDVLLDSALPLRDVSARLNSGAVGYGRTFGLAGRQANITFIAPYIRGNVEGKVFEDFQQVRRSGLGDVRIRFSTILKGGPALKPREFAAQKPAMHLGASFTVIAPTGQYDPRRLVNLGSNRWAFKPEVGLSKPAGRWTFEVVSGVWFFTKNSNFFGGAQREQKPLGSVGGHVIYTIRRRMWASVNATYFTGGRTVLNGVTNDDLQRSSRAGATFSFPLNQRQSIKVAYSKGVTVRFGGDMSTVAVAWQYVWFSGPWELGLGPLVLALGTWDLGLGTWAFGLGWTGDERGSGPTVKEG